MADRPTRLALRRERLLEEHSIDIVERNHTEERFYKTREGKQESYYIDFTHEVLQSGKHIAHASSRRYALKAAHNHIRRTRR